MALWRETSSLILTLLTNEQLVLAGPRPKWIFAIRHLVDHFVPRAAEKLNNFNLRNFIMIHLSAY